MVCELYQDKYIHVTHITGVINPSDNFTKAMMCCRPRSTGSGGLNHGPWPILPYLRAT